MAEQVGIEGESVSHIVDGTSLVTSFHAEGSTELEDLGIVDMKDVDKVVKVLEGFIKLLHLTKHRSPLFVSSGIGRIGGYGLSGLNDGFNRCHINYLFVLVPLAGL